MTCQASLRAAKRPSAPPGVRDPASPSASQGAADTTLGACVTASYSACTFAALLLLLPSRLRPRSWLPINVPCYACFLRHAAAGPQKLRDSPPHQSPLQPPHCSRTAVFASNSIAAVVTTSGRIGLKPIGHPLRSPQHLAVVLEAGHSLLDTTKGSRKVEDVRFAAAQGAARAPLVMRFVR